MTVTQLNRSMMNSAKWVFNILILFLLNLVFLVPDRHLITIAVENSTVETSAINIIKDGQLLISTNKNFALGFFSLNNSTNRRYVGIWYNDIPDLTLVWVANRDQPLNDDSGTFAIDTHGNLVIYSHTQNISLWSTNVSISSMNDVSVQLLDTGNLEVIQRQNQKILWQSFDYPSHTLLPYMKIGFDRRTGFSRFLTSWKARDDPGTGNFTHRINPTGYPQLVLYKNDVPMWRAGTWTGRRFSGVPEMTTLFILNATYVDDADEVSLEIGVKDEIFTRLRLDESGFLSLTWRREKDRNWVELWSAPKELCDNYNQCGPNSNCDPYNSEQFRCTCLPGFHPRQPRDWSMRDASGGCVRKRENATCRSGEGFVTVARVKVPDGLKASADKNMSLEACREACLEDCNCTAYTSADVRTGIGCVTWYGDLKDTRTYANASVGQELFVRVDAIELAQYAQNSNRHSARNKVVTVVVVSIVATSLLFTTIVVYLWHKRRKKKEMQSLSNYFDDSPIPRELLGDQSRNTSDHLPVVFDLNTIAKATDHFSFENKLGQGGFGSVYKGMLKSGEEIAVKRLAKNSGQGIGEFKNEATLIAKLQHRNLVRILGYCVQHEEKMLVYEYLPNKSLDSFIFDESKRVLLDWTKRFEIIIGVARGILYLHQDSRLKIIHRDLKAGNILLDDNLNPKIADFGMAKIFMYDQIVANTNRIVGTFGYMSPEYAMEGLCSEKSDVYSFGVLLLEIIAGRKNHSFKDSSRCTNLVGHVWELWNQEKAMEVVDSTLDELKSSFENVIIKCIQIGLLCVQDDSTNRPAMSTVVFMLSNEVTLPTPKKPLFIFKRSNPSTSDIEGTNSINNVTISMLEVR